MSDVDPLSYKIYLEPNLETFRFFGRTKILLEASGGVNEIVLNALDMAVWSCKVDLDGRLAACPFQVDPENEVLRVSLPKKLTGRIEVAIEYEGRIGVGMKEIRLMDYGNGHIRLPRSSWHHPASRGGNAEIAKTVVFLSYPAVAEIGEEGSPLKGVGNLSSQCLRNCVGVMESFFLNWLEK